MIKIAYSAVTIIVLAGCSAMNVPKTPDFYPNEQYTKAGPAQARAASQYCMALADEYVQKPDRFNAALKEGAKDAVIGTAVGAVGGAVFSKAGRGAGAGAAVGGILGVVKSLQETGQNSPGYERFVEHCLQKKGYEVVGWSSKSGSKV